MTPPLEPLTGESGDAPHDIPPLTPRPPRPHWSAFLLLRAISLELGASMRFKDHQKYLLWVAALTAASAVVLLVTTFISNADWVGFFWLGPMVLMVAALAYPAYRLVKYNDFSTWRRNTPIQTWVPGHGLGPGLRPPATPNLFDAVLMIFCVPAFTMIALGMDRSASAIAPLLPGGITSLDAWGQLAELLWAALPKGAFAVLNFWFAMSIIGALIQAAKQKYHLLHNVLLGVMIVANAISVKMAMMQPIKQGLITMGRYGYVFLAAMIALVALSWWIAYTIRRDAQRRLLGLEQRDNIVGWIPGEHYDRARDVTHIPLPILPFSESQLRKAATRTLMTPARMLLVIVPAFVLVLVWGGGDAKAPLSPLSLVAMLTCTLWLIAYTTRHAAQRPGRSFEGQPANASHHLIVGVIFISVVGTLIWCIMTGTEHTQAKSFLILALMTLMMAAAVPNWQHRPALEIVHARELPPWARGGVKARVRRSWRKWMRSSMTVPIDARGRVETTSVRARLSAWWAEMRQHYPVNLIPRLWMVVAFAALVVWGMRALVMIESPNAPRDRGPLSAVAVLVLHVIALWVVVKRLRQEPERTLTQKIGYAYPAEPRVAKALERRAPGWPMVLHDCALAAAFYGLLVWLYLTPGITISPRQGLLWESGAPLESRAVWVMSAWPLASLLGIGFVVGLWPRLQRYGIAFLGVLGLFFVMTTSGTPFVLLVPPALYYAVMWLERRVYPAIVATLLTPEDPDTDDAPRRVRPPKHEYFRTNSEDKYVADEARYSYYDTTTAHVSPERFRRGVRVAFFLAMVAYVMVHVPETAMRAMAYKPLMHIAFWLLTIVLYVVARGSTLAVMRPSVWWSLRCRSYMQWPLFWRDLGFRSAFWAMMVGWPFLVWHQGWPLDVGFFSGLLVLGLLLQLDHGDSQELQIRYPYRPRRPGK